MKDGKLKALYDPDSVASAIHRSSLNCHRSHQTATGSVPLIDEYHTPQRLQTTATAKLVVRSTIDDLIDDRLMSERWVGIGRSYVHSGIGYPPISHEQADTDEPCDSLRKWVVETIDSGKCRESSLCGSENPQEKLSDNNTVPISAGKVCGSSTVLNSRRKNGVRKWQLKSAGKVPAIKRVRVRRKIRQWTGQVEDRTARKKLYDKDGAPKDLKICA